MVLSLPGNFDRQSEWAVLRLCVGGLIMLLSASQAAAETSPKTEASWEKTAGEVTANGDGTYTVPITLEAVNTGDEKLVRLQLKDDLDIFGTGQLVDVSTPEVLAGELTLNPGYDGLSDIRLLAGRDSLKPGAEASLRFELTFDPGTESGPFLNRALIWTKGKQTGTVLDSYAKAAIEIPLKPEARWKKTAGEVVANGDGTFNVPITLTATNIGDEELIDLQLKDNLDIFGSGKVISVSVPDVLEGELALNPNYDGLDDIRLLAGSDTLPPGETVSLRFDVTFDPGKEPGPFLNRALIWTEGKHSGIVLDFYARDHIRMPVLPEASWEKTAGQVVANGDGTYTVPITLAATNTGSEELIRLQFRDNLDIFGSGQVISVSTPRILSGVLTLNPSFDGLSEDRLLEGNDTLLPAEEASLGFDITFDPDIETGPFTNRAAIEAEGKDSGIEIDFGETAIIRLPPVPELALDKTAGSIVANGDGSLSVPVTLTMANIGNEDLEELQLEDDLNIFGAGQLIAVEDIDAPGLTLNPAFDGLTDIMLLAGSDPLAVGSTASVNFTLRFDPGPEPGPFLNTAVTTATGDTTGTDVSDSDDASFLAVSTRSIAAIAVVQTAGEVSDNGDGSLSVPITVTMINTGNEPLVSLQVEDDLNIFGSGRLLAVEDFVAPGLSLNAAYDGLTDALLLDGTDLLPLGSAATVSFTLRFDPGGEAGPFLNTANATAIGSTTGTPVNDSDVASFLSAPTLPAAAIALVKDAGSVTRNGDGSLSVPITLTATNTGNEALSALRLDDDLNIFGAGRLIAVEDIDAPGLTLNPGFDGLTDIMLLAGSDTLPVGSAASVNFTLRFDPGGEPGPFLNTAVTTATGDTSGTVVSDSDDTSFLAASTRSIATIEVIKTAGEVSDNGDGSLSVPISLTMTNTGNESLASLQVEDDLNIFGAGQLLAVENIVAPGLSLNAAYDGLTDALLLDGTNLLPLGSAATVGFTLRFDPAGEPGPFLNTAVTTATGDTTGTVVSDSDDASFLAVPSEPGPAIDVQKFAGEVSAAADGKLTVPITITVTNTGNDALTFLQLEDSLDIFGDGQLIAVEELASATLSLNPNYDGLSDINLLAGSDDLPITTSGTLTFVLRFDPGAEPGPFDNVVTATASGAISGLPVSDSSDASFNRIGPPPLGPAGIFVTNIADRSQVMRGDTVGYHVSVINLTDNPVAGAVIAGNPPPGFRFVGETAMLIRAGADGSLNTADDVVSPIGTDGTAPVMFDAFDLGPDERLLVRYLMRVGVGVADGEYINSVTVTPVRRSPFSAYASVTVVGDPIFEKTTLIGKVFNDQNGNARQDEDEGERGIPGVRLATVGGLIIETDAMGRYHLADVDVDRFERGANFIIKLDMASLPEQTEMISENPRVIRLTQATLSKVNFAVKLPTGNPVSCLENGLRSESGVDPSKADCPVSAGSMPSDTADARHITVSGGLFGCGMLVAETLPGRSSGRGSEVTVFAGEAGTAYQVGHDVCNDKDKDKDSNGVVSQRPCDVIIKVGRYPLELTTESDTRLRITGAGDVIRCDDPQNSEHIFVTPFRDDTDNSVISALRVVNDGIGPGSAVASSSKFAGTSSRIKPATADVLFNDPRLDVLALNRAVVHGNGKLSEPIQFAIYTNYSAFIEGYRLEVYGSSKDGFEKKLLHEYEFSEYRFDQRLEFSDMGPERRRYLELEYLLKASNCPPPFNEKHCIFDITSRRILKLHPARVPEVDHRPEPGPVVHHENELWGQTSLASQRIPVRGGRVRFSGSFDPTETYVVINGSYVPIGKDGNYVLEEHLPPGNYNFSLEAGSAVAARSSDPIPADTGKIKVSGGLFGCDQVEIDSLAGREKNNGDVIHAVTVVADPDGQGAKAGVCPQGITAGEYPIEITSDKGSRLQVTAAGDVLSLGHPSPEDNRQQLVVTPFRDYTDSTIVSALRIANEGFPGESPTAPPRMGPIVTVEEHDWFTVALASLTVGQNNVSGNTLPLSADDHFDGSTFTDGRLAIYTKGKLNDKYLITAQLDSTEDELGNLSDNLKRKDPRRIFRQLDPNLYYPIYGDDSTTTTDVDTQGAFYARVDWDRSMALWGNYNTGLTDTEFMQYNRSLYGAKFVHENLETTEFGNAKTRVTVFGSEAQSVAAHVTFRATGGSLYYLRDTDIVQGSEKVWIEVRRRDTEQVVELAVLIEGRDYEIDAIQGRIILRRPLSQVVNDRARSIIRSSPLEGDEVFLLADYEYVPATFVADDLTYGGRGQAWLGDHVAIGATAITDERNGTDYELQGVDLNLQHSEGSYLRAEFAQSRARQNNDNFISFDGGLSFQSQTSGGPGDRLDGDAIAIEARAELAEFSESLRGDVRAWWKTREAEFSTGRLGQGIGVNDRGVELYAKTGNDIQVSAAYTDLEREQLSRERVTRIQVEGKLGDFDAGVEVRHENIEFQAPAPATPISGLNGASVDGEALLIGARLGYDIDEATKIYAAVQTVADDKGVYQENNLLTTGVNTQLNGELAVSIEASDGDRGSALIAGVDYAADNGLDFSLSGGVGSGAISQFATQYAIGDGHELYGSYAVDPDRTEGARNMLTFGQRRAFGNGVGLFAESQFGKDDRYASVGHVFGLEFEGNDDWKFSASMQFSENEGLGLAFDRRALSFGVYRNQGDLKLSSRIEYREDEGASVHNRQWVSSNSFTRVLDENRRWLGLLNVSWTDDELNGGQDARFVELDIGYAHRPAANDKVNLIARYSFLYDLPTEGQVSIRPDERSHLLSVEGIYDPLNRWEFAAKIAVRMGERRTLRDTGPWQDFGLRLASVRTRYQVNKSWDGLAEYRWLSDIDGDNVRHGVLLALYRQLGENFKAGVGFNFTDFDDSLRIDSYDNSGWFVDFVGMY